MSIYAINSDGDPYVIDYEVYNEPLGSGNVPELVAQIRIPQKEKEGQFHIVHLFVDEITGRPWTEVLPHGVQPTIKGPNIWSKVIGAWGTKPRTTEIMVQQQDNHLVQFHYDADFDFDYSGGRPAPSNDPDGRYAKGDDRWRIRGNYGGWPQGLCRAIYLRAETGRKSTEGRGLAQINFASRADEARNDTGYKSFRSQGKGETEPGNLNSSTDMLRVVIDPKTGGLPVRVNGRSLGLYLHHGFELKY
jgi:hypothetical protein